MARVSTIDVLFKLGFALFFRQRNTEKEKKKLTSVNQTGIFSEKSENKSKGHWEVKWDKKKKKRKRTLKVAIQEKGWKQLQSVSWGSLLAQTLSSSVTVNFQEISMNTFLQLCAVWSSWSIVRECQDKCCE